jgi:hypothetical protein
MPKSNPGRYDENRRSSQDRTIRPNTPETGLTVANVRRFQNPP